MQRRGTPPDLRSLNPRVSETLAQIVQRAMAKKLEDRYANLGEMITDLEGFLGLMGQASQTLTTDQADRLKLASEAFHGAALSKLRMPIVLGSVLLAALLSALLVLVSPKWALFPPLTMLVAIVTYLIVGAWQGRSPLASACRQSIAYSRWTDWLTWAAGLAVMLCAIYLLGMLTVAITGLVFGVAAGAAYGLVLDKAIAAQRRASLAELEGLVRELRLSGLDELQVRRLIARFSGKHWEESFEQLFGFRAVEPTRDELRRMNELENKSSFWPWRTWIIARLQRRLDEQKRQREQTKLVRIEKAGLQAEGLTGAEADARAWQMAAALMESAQPVVSATSNDRNAEIAAFEKRRKMKSMMADARSGKYRAPARPIRGTLAFVFGGKPRFLLGCVLLVAFALWARSNGIVGEQTLQQIKTDATQEQINQTVIGVGKRLFFANDTQPVLSGFVHGVGTAAAGLILVISALSGGVRMSVLTYPAAAIAFLGAQFGIPALAMVNAETLRAPPDVLHLFPLSFSAANRSKGLICISILAGPKPSGDTSLNDERLGQSSYISSGRTQALR